MNVFNSLQKNALSNTNSMKVLVDCATKLKNTSNTKDWLSIEKTLKIIQTYDKSRVFYGVLEKNQQVVVKIGDDKSITNEYNIGDKLKYRKGFIKFLCYFECDDDFLSYINPMAHKNYLCKGQGNSMRVIVMPYYMNGSLGDYCWNNDNIDVLKSCIKQVVLIIWINFSRYGFVHGDLHAKNILLDNVQPTNLILSYNIKNKKIEIQKKQFEPIIMDFENSTFEDKNNPTSIVKFYWDFNKFFSLLPTFIKNIDKSSLFNIVGKLSLISNESRFNEENIIDLLNLIDDITLDKF